MSGTPADSCISGALFDLMGYLTTREEVLVLSAHHEASPAVSAITAFAKNRKLDTESADIMGWQKRISASDYTLRDQELSAKGWQKVVCGACGSDTARAEPVTRREVADLDRAKNLCTKLWEAHYKGRSPGFTPVSSMNGVLIQLEYMVGGLKRCS